jgi:hypothetical protein
MISAQIQHHEDDRIRVQDLNTRDKERRIRSRKSVGRNIRRGGRGRGGRDRKTERKRADHREAQPSFFLHHNSTKRVIEAARAEL